MILKDKVAIVTGSAVGIGRAIAVAFGREGASVTVNYGKSEKEAKETVRMIEEAGGRAILVQADVSVDSQARELVRKTLDAFGRLDVLVNNAAITRFVPFNDLEGLTEEAWDSLYAVNVKGTFFCARAAAPVMKAQKNGVIINFASVAGLKAAGTSIAYSVTKAAVIHLTMCLANTLAPEIRVNVIVPGFIDETRWYSGQPNYEDIRNSFVRSAPLGRVGKPADVVEASLYFAKSASFVTGAMLIVDGGRHLI